MKLEYNTTRSKMLMPEYGRNVQKMVEFIMSLEDRQQRLKNAEAVIELMATLTPHLKTMEDYQHKLWDHLFQMTGFKLDVDSPFPAPTPEAVFKKPEVLPYPQNNIPHRHLGKNLDGLLQLALKETDPEKKQGLTQAVGYYMKLAYTNWHREPVHDDMIKTELAVLSGGQLTYETGGYRVPFDLAVGPRNSNFKQRGGGGDRGGGRNFKGGGGGRNFGNGGGGERGDRYGNNSGGGGGGYNKNRKFKKK